MYELHVEEDLDTRPTVVSYNSVLDAYAKKTNRIMNTDQNKNFNSKNKHRNNAEDESVPWKRAEAILNHMIDLYHLGDLGVKPNDRTWNTGK